MKSLVLAVTALGVLAFALPAQAGPNCTGSKTQEQTAETPPPPPPSPST